MKKFVMAATAVSFSALCDVIASFCVTINPMIDYSKTYFAKIEASVGSTLFQHLYVSENGTDSQKSVDVMNNGELSCAAHVSSVLVLSGLLDAPHATVSSTIAALKKQGWHETNEPTPGAIILWPESADKHQHVGFYLSDEAAISNSTEARVPIHHPLVMKDGRAPLLFLTHDHIANSAAPNADTRNVIDKYHHQSVAAIVSDLDTSRSTLEIAIENLTRDFNMGTIVRTANAFNVGRVHIIGRHQWNKRGAMKTDAYLHIDYYETVDDFIDAVKKRGKTVVAVDIVPEATPLHQVALPEESVLVFGAEGPGITAELLQKADMTVFIEQFGSTRSINVGVAAGIAMYSWMQQHRLSCTNTPSVQE